MLICAAALALAKLTPSPEPDRPQPRETPDLSAVRSDRLSEALSDPERLWLFLTDPDTPYPERRAAAVQGAPRFPRARAGGRIRRSWGMPGRFPPNPSTIP